MEKWRLFYGVDEWKQNISRTLVALPIRDSPPYSNSVYACRDTMQQQHKWNLFVEQTFRQLFRINNTWKNVRTLTFAIIASVTPMGNICDKKKTSTNYATTTNKKQKIFEKLNCEIIRELNWPHFCPEPNIYFALQPRKRMQNTPKCNWNAEKILNDSIPNSLSLYTKKFLFDQNFLPKNRFCLHCWRA